ncbi:Poly [ADP-ribose] polymerase 6 [Acipenser ruthenus]|uniref:Poly [ADP-ribose] polymerase 6 n=1 Tax=Acipenser ruthenus TaxID=7906 RepID=A0A444UG10_ACIRT|nr:Poly [ADP-ribose] polymerase 6 [Acipenser ruthenus]
MMKLQGRDIKGQYWTDEDSDGDNDSEFLYGIQGSCAADLYRHPQLDADIEAVKEIYTDTALSVRILGMFTSQQWKHLSNDFLKSQQEKRHSWFKAGGTIKKFRAGLSIFSPIPNQRSTETRSRLCRGAHRHRHSSAEEHTDTDTDTALQRSTQTQLCRGAHRHSSAEEHTDTDTALQRRTQTQTRLCRRAHRHRHGHRHGSAEEHTDTDTDTDTALQRSTQTQTQLCRAAHRHGSAEEHTHRHGSAEEHTDTDTALQRSRQKCPH